jgi:hypothetical protein|tara:strand:+ start:1395 stop:1547 length:153 start_codon:yes stop_codon:yes gene_type:complete
MSLPVDKLIGMGIFLLVLLMMWSKMRKQTLRETMDEIKEQLVDKPTNPFE